MDPIDNAPEVQNPGTSTPAPGLTESQADTPTSLAQQAADSNNALKAFYEKQQPGFVEQTQEEATPEPEPEAKVEPEPEAEAPDPEDDPKAPEQMRPRLHDPEDIAVAALAKARGIKLSEAAAIIAGTPKATPIPGLDETPQPSSATVELQSQVDALALEIKTEREGEDYLNPAHFDKVDRLADLKAELRVAKLQENLEGQGRAKDAATAAATSHQTAVQSSIAAVQKEYPTLTVKDSPLATASNAVIAEWQADPARAPRLAQADAPALVAAEAAYRTGNDLFKTGKFPTLDLALASLKTATVAPVAKTPPPPASAPVAPVRKVNPPSGSKTQVVSGQTPTLQEAINVSTDPAEKARLSNLALASSLAVTNGSPNGGRRRGS